MKISEIFEPGHRKTTMAVIALIGTIVLEKYGGGISADLKEMILAILAIFTGGNVLSKGIQAAKDIKVQKQITSEIVTDMIDDAPPVKEQEQDALINSVIEHVNNLDKAAGTEIKSLKERLDKTDESIQGVSDRLDVQVKNLSQVLTILNGMRNGQQPTA